MGDELTLERRSDRQSTSCNSLRWGRQSCTCRGKWWSAGLLWNVHLFNQQMTRRLLLLLHRSLPSTCSTQNNKTKGRLCLFFSTERGKKQKNFQNVKSEHLPINTFSRFTMNETHLELHIKKKIKKRKKTNRQFRGIYGQIFLGWCSFTYNSIQGNENQLRKTTMEDGWRWNETYQSRRRTRREGVRWSRTLWRRRRCAP